MDISSIRSRLCFTAATLTFTSLTALVWPIPAAQSQSSSDRAVTLLADVQEANAKTGILTATGNVQIFYPLQDLSATSLQAQYFSRERRIVLTGNVQIIQGDGNVIQGEQVTYLLDEDRFLIAPKENEQVRSVYRIPESPDAAQPSGIPDLPTETAPTSDRLEDLLPAAEPEPASEP